MPQQQQFKGYSNEQMERIASKLGHTGDLSTFDGYLNSNPKAMDKYNALNGAVTKRYAQGGSVMAGSPIKQNTIYGATADQTGLEQTSIERALNPGLMDQANTKAYDTGYYSNQSIATTSGNAGLNPSATTTSAGFTGAVKPTSSTNTNIGTATSTQGVTDATNIQGATGTVSNQMQGAQGTVDQQAVAQQGTAGQVAGTTPLKSNTATAAVSYTHLTLPTIYSV